MSGSTGAELPGREHYNETAKTTSSSNVNNTQAIDTELKRILQTAGIESAPMDPSSAEYLRKMIAVELDNVNDTTVTTTPGSSSEASAENKDEYDISAVARVDSDRSKSVFKDIGVTYLGIDKDEATASLASSLKTPVTDFATARNTAETKTISSTTTHLDAAKTLTAAMTTSSGTSSEEKHTSDDVKNDEGFVPDTDTSSVMLIAMLRKELKEQKRTMDDQSKILLLLNDHIRELTNVVHSLKESVEDVKQQRKSEAPIAALSTPHWGVPDHPATPAEPVGPVGPVEPAEVDRQAPNNNEFRRAHELAHHVAWRIASFPVRALIFYLKYEYRIWLVLSRLAKRDIPNPFRDAGMVFQLGFGLLIVYGRIAPALEQAWEKQQEKYDDDDDDDSYGKGEDFMDDPQFQVQAIAMALLFAFLYHLGIIGLFYRFFIRDRLHVRIWKDLRAGVELTPSYGLDLDQNNNLGGEQGRNANNGGPPPPNRGPPLVRGNDQGNGGGGGFGIIHGVNDFFMGHHRRPEQRAAIGGGAFARPNGNNNDFEGNPLEEDADAGAQNPRNPVVNLVSDITCLLYSFFVSILPTWNYEQQLRDIQEEQDRLVRARVQREADALRNQNNNGDEEESESESESESDSDSDSDSDRSESESEDSTN